MFYYLVNILLDSRVIIRIKLDGKGSVLILVEGNWIV